MSAYKSKYSWKDGYSYSISADIVGGVIEQIEERDGEVTARSFLEASRPEDSATHSMFEWDDEVAAEKYRLSQSGRIIHQIEVEIEEDGDTVKTSGFVNVDVKRPATDGRYVSIGKAMDDDEMKLIVLQNAYRELVAFQKKYDKYKELSGVMNEIVLFGETMKRKVS